MVCSGKEASISVEKDAGKGEGVLVGGQSRRPRGCNSGETV